MVQEITATLQYKEYLTSDVLYLSFQVSNEFTFQAGQFAIFMIPHEGKQRPKSYSILNPPSEKGKIDLCVKIIPQGIASEAFKAAQVGDTFPVKGPLGHFVFDLEAEEHCFIGAGTGVAPLYSMIKEYLPHFSQKKFTLLFGVRQRQNLFLHQELLELAQRYPNFEYIPTLSRDIWEGKMGRVQQHLGNELQNKTFYLCGLKELVVETKELLLQRGVDAARIRFERYN